MMFRKWTLVIALCAVLPLGAAPQAQDKPEDYAAALRQDCGKEIRTLCSGVTNGRGRLLACLYARESKLSPRCGDRVYGSLERLGEALGALANVRRVCDADVRRLCQGVQPGNGHLIDCLAKARPSVSERCNATLDLAFLRP
jgi:hypothetical protein